MKPDPEAAGTAALRIDKWLWFCRFFRSRSQVQTAIAAGAIWLNGRQVDRPAQGVRLGDQVTLSLGRIEKRVVVQALGTRRGPAIEIQQLYQDVGVVEKDVRPTENDLIPEWRRGR
jgi:ribosome-associated heat shock protein Hsp15